MRIKNILLLSASLLILLSFSSAVVLPTSWNICIPSGCNFEKSGCDSDSCANETLDQHLSERTQLLHIPIKFKGLMILAIASVLLFTAQKYTKFFQLLFIKLYWKRRLFNPPDSNLFNYLVELFSQGILNPKVY